MDLIFESLIFSLFLFDCFLVWAFHLCNEFDLQHVLVQAGNELELKVGEFFFLLLDEKLELFYLRNKGGSIVGEIHLHPFILAAEFSIPVIEIINFDVELGNSFLQGEHLLSKLISMGFGEIVGLLDGEIVSDHILDIVIHDNNLKQQPPIIIR